jgi:hypothetical protein
MDWRDIQTQHGRNLEALAFSAIRSALPALKSIGP